VELQGELTAEKLKTQEDKTMKTLISSILVYGMLGSLTACTTSSRYEGAFAKATSIQGNSHTFQATPDQTLRAVTGTLVAKGFNIDQTDGAMGLIKATRNYSDPKAPDTNYHITATAYVSESPADQGSVVTLSASQQTVLYRKMHSWSMLPIVPIPIPTGRKFETVTTGEGAIVSSGFYADFFAAVDEALARTNTAGAARAATVTALDAAQPLPAAR
jgi:hypothetical protein